MRASATGCRDPQWRCGRRACRLLPLVGGQQHGEVACFSQVIEHLPDGDTRDGRAVVGCRGRRSWGCEPVTGNLSRRRIPRRRLGLRARTWSGRPFEHIVDVFDPAPREAAYRACVDAEFSSTVRSDRWSWPAG